MAYQIFARYYDALTGNVDYPGRARYFDGLIRRHRDKREILLDVGCGTGSLSMELAALGYDVIGADPSEDMLAVAACKEAPEGKRPLFLNQSMEELDLYGTVDAAVCALDTVNHVQSEEALKAGFSRISLFLEPGGVFLFDVNTAYKHRVVLADHAFAYDLEEVFCVWQNAYRPEDGSVDITLDFFLPEGSGRGTRYRRESESFVERLYSQEVLEELLNAAGLELLHLYGEDSLEPPREDTQRLVYVARKR